MFMRILNKLITKNQFKPNIECVFKLSIVCSAYIGFVDHFYDYWIQKLHNSYTFWIQKLFGPFSQFHLSEAPSPTVGNNRLFHQPP